jgi:hypothetical protein
MGAKAVGCGKVDRVVTFAGVEGAAVGLDTFDDDGDDDVGVCVAVTVGIGAEVVWN